MTRIKFILVLVIGASIFKINAQDFFVTQTNDTTRGSQMGFSTNGRGFLTDLSYIDKKGQKVEISKRKNLGHIVCLTSGGTIYDRMPLKTKKPNGYHRFGERLVSGKIKVSLYNNLHQTTSYNPYYPGVAEGRTSAYQTTTSGTRLFQVTMPDGKIYTVKRKNINKVIKPYLLQCEKFAAEYKGKFSAEQGQFVEMIRLYNKLCS